MTNERILVPCVYQLVLFFSRDLRATAVRRAIAFLCVLSSGRAPQSLLLLPRRLARASSHECARHEGSDVDPQISSCRGSRVAQTSSAVAGVVGGTRVASLALGCAIGLCFAALFGARGVDVLLRGVFVQTHIRSPHPTRASPLSPPRDVSPPASRLAGSTRLGSKKHQN